MLFSKTNLKAFCLVTLFCFLSACGLNDLSKKSDSESSPQAGTEPQATPPNPQKFEVHFQDLTSNAPVTISSTRISSFPSQFMLSHLLDGFGLYFDDFSDSNYNSHFNASLIFEGYENCPIQFAASIGSTITDQNDNLPTLFGQISYFDNVEQRFLSKYVFTITTDPLNTRPTSEFTACDHSFSVTAKTMSYPSVLDRP